MSLLAGLVLACPGGDGDGGDPPPTTPPPASTEIAWKAGSTVLFAPSGVDASVDVQDATGTSCSRATRRVARRSPHSGQTPPSRAAAAACRAAMWHPGALLQWRDLAGERLRGARLRTLHRGGRRGPLRTLSRGHRLAPGARRCLYPRATRSARLTPTGRLRPDLRKALRPLGLRVRDESPGCRVSPSCPSAFVPGARFHAQNRTPGATMPGSASYRGVWHHDWHQAWVATSPGSRRGRHERPASRRPLETVPADSPPPSASVGAGTDPGTRLEGSRRDSTPRFPGHEPAWRTWASARERDGCARSVPARSPRSPDRQHRRGVSARPTLRPRCGAGEDPRWPFAPECSPFVVPWSLPRRCPPRMCPRAGGAPCARA